MDCEACDYNLNIRHHNCTTHSACFVDQLWSPSNCLQCINLFEKADESEEGSIEKLRTLSKKFVDRTSLSGFKGTIFSNKFEFDKFFRTFLKLSGKKKENLDPNPENKTTVSAHSSLSHSLPIQNISGLPIVEEVVPFSNNELTSNLRIQTNNSFLVQSSNPVAILSNSDVSDLLTSTERNVIAENLEPLPDSSSSSVVTLATVTSTLATVNQSNFNYPIASSLNLPRVAFSTFLPECSSSRPSEIPFSVGSNNADPLLSSASNIFRSAPVSPPVAPDVLQQNLAATARIRAPCSYSNSFAASGNICQQQPLQELNYNSFLNSQRNNPESYEGANIAYPIQDQENYYYEQASDELNFKHWPGLEALTFVDDDMLEFLNKDNPPTIFILPSASPSLLIAQEGIMFQNFQFSSQDIFVGIYKNKTCLIVKNPSSDSAEFCLSLPRLVEQLEEEEIDLNKIGALFTNYCDHAKEQFSPCEFLSKDSKIEAVFNSLNLSELQDLSQKTLGKIQKFSSKDIEDDKILKCLQEPMLTQESHSIPNALQQVTLPISKEDRELDFSKRKEALKAVVSYASCKETYKASCYFYNKANPQTKQDKNFDMLTGLKGVFQISLKSLESLCFNSLEDVKKFRMSLRSKSIAKVTESVLKKNLLDSDPWSLNLFSDSASTHIFKAIDTPAPRSIELQGSLNSKTNKGSNPKNTLPGRRERDGSALRSLWKKRKFGRGGRLGTQSLRNAGKFNFSRFPHPRSQSFYGQNRFPNQESYPPSHNFSHGNHFAMPYPNQDGNQFNIPYPAHVRNHYPGQGVSAPNVHQFSGPQFPAPFAPQGSQRSRAASRGQKFRGNRGRHF